MEQAASRSNGRLVTGDDKQGIWYRVTRGTEESD